MLLDSTETVLRELGSERMTPVTAAKRKRIVNLVKKYLAPRQPSDWSLVVRPDAIEHDGDWYCVLVGPSREDARSYEYYGRLAEAEIDLRDKEHLNILLVPVLPS
jgi:hypothetical protein